MKFNQLLHCLRSIGVMQKIKITKREVNIHKSISGLAKSVILTGGLILLCAANAQAAKFQAEDYSYYSDNTEGNEGGEYRDDDVDIQSTADTYGNFNVAWIEAGEWLAYSNLTIPTTGSYTIRMRVASPNGATASVDLNGGAIRFGNLTIPATGGWQSWRTVTKIVNINAGTYNLGVFAQTAGWNFNWIEVTSNNTVGSSSKPSSSIRSSTAPSSIPRSSIPASSVKSSVIASSVKSSVGSSVKSSAGRTLVWEDNFDNINTSNWTNDVGNGPQGWGNNELEYYTNGNNIRTIFDSQADSNVLLMEARKENPANYQCWYGSCQYTSSKLITAGKQEFMYGRIEARLKVPQTQGIWPAFWMLGTNLSSVGWPQSGEIDIMEHIGKEPTLSHGALHGPGYSGGNPIVGTYNIGENIESKFHVYAIEWDENAITWYVDNVKFHQATKAAVLAKGHAWVFDHNFYIILNVAVGGGWPGSPDGTSSFPKQMLVDYVRVYGDGIIQVSDADGDGYADDVDAFPNDAKEWLDSDLDGVGNNTDAFPFDPRETTDTDGDRVGNNADTDDDDDGYLDINDAYPLDKTRCCLDPNPVVIFQPGTGLTNGFTWRFWQWDIAKHSVTNPDGSVYTVGGPARLNMGAGHSIPFEKADKTLFDVSNAQTLELTYSSEKPFEILILWGVPLEGWVESGYPYWTQQTYLNGGFLQVKVPASSGTSVFSVKLSDLPSPVNDYFVKELNLPPAVTDPTKIQMLLFKSSVEQVNVTINDVRFVKSSGISSSIKPSSVPKSSIRSSLPPASVGYSSSVASIPTGSIGSSSSKSSTSNPGHEGWDEVWVDHFNGPAGTGVDRSVWDYDLGTCYLLNGACTPHGNNWGTWEVETMTDSTNNVYLDGQGHLYIKPIHTGNIPQEGWTSGRIETKRMDFNAPVGGIMRMEGRLKQPNVSGVEATGYWPAFWALGSGFRGVYTNWPMVGEIDIMEVVNGRDSVWATLHCGVWAVGPCNETTGLGTGEQPNPTGKTEFHIYAMEYDRSKTPEEIRWYLDDKLTGTVKQNQSGPVSQQGGLAANPSVWSDALHHKGFFMLLNVAMGGAFPIAIPPNNDITMGGTKSGVPMIVDYVGVWTKTPAPCTPNVDCPPPPPPPPVSTPYLDVNGAAVPGIIQFKNFDKGGQGVAFSDTTPTNKGAFAYRTDITGETTSVPVDIASNCGGCVNYVNQGEWLNYTINVATAGTYSLYISQAGAGGGSFHVELEDGSDLTGAWVQPKTTNWDTYQTDWKQIALPAGKHILKFVFDSCTGSLCALNNLKEFELKFDSTVVTSRSSASTSSRASSSSPSSVGPRTLVWSDEFDTINSANWSYETGGHGWGNNELQNYTNGQNSAIEFDASVGSNVMAITAKQDSNGNFTSSRMISYNKKMFKYGRIEARLKLPQTQGIWPAFWMMGRSIKEGTGWPVCGEIDIMEHIGKEPNTTHAAVHGPGYSGATPIFGDNHLNERVDANYHVYAVEWNANSMTWFMDGVQFYSTTKTNIQRYGNWVFDQEMFLLLNVAVGGSWPGNPDGSSTFPQKMYVDYVRVYQ